MKIYVHEKGFIIVGKAWELREKLREYSKDYYLLKDLIYSRKPTNVKRSGYLSKSGGYM